MTKALVNLDFQTALAFKPYLPGFFPKWDRTVDGLEQAGKWATEVERSRLPSDIVFPRVGQVWETVRDCEVTFRPCFDLPPVNGTGTSGFALQLRLGGMVRMREGERIRILGLEHPDKPLDVRFQPLRYSELHAAIVPDEIRQKPGYRGYELSVYSARTLPQFSKQPSQTYFNEAFKMVADLA